MRAVIVGCGVAGPVLGMYLKRVGIDVVVYEAKAEAPGEEGGFLSLSPNGLNVLRSLGIESKVQAVGTPCVSMLFHDRKGKLISEIDLRQLPELYGTNSVIVRRALLHEVLREEARLAGVPLEFGHGFVGADRPAESRSVVAHFDSGDSVEGNLLLGCDGIHSCVRKVLYPDNAEPSWTGLVDVAGFARVPGLESTDGELRTFFGHEAFFAYFTARDGDTYWFSNLPADHEPARDVLCGRTVDEWREVLLAAHEKDPAPIPDIVRAFDRLRVWGMYDLLALPRWSEGRVCLLGDAAHATTPHFGQGASIALEDSIVLAKCLRDAADFQTAFSRYELLRRARVDQLELASKRMGTRKAPSNPIQRWVRDRFLPLFLRANQKATETIYSYRVAWQEA